MIRRVIGWRVSEGLSFYSLQVPMFTSSKVHEFQGSQVYGFGRLIFWEQMDIIFVKLGLFVKKVQPVAVHLAIFGVFTLPVCISATRFFNSLRKFLLEYGVVGFAKKFFSMVD